MPARVFEIAIDATDPALLRPFWMSALGYVERVTAEGAVDLVDPEGRGPTVWFQRVPETKTAKNRIHVDIRVGSSERPAITRELVALGGTVVSSFPRFTVLADPEGNELCLTES
jgi:4a-hydroxytetrahydrobiopterin dehydratase